MQVFWDWKSQLLSLAQRLPKAWREREWNACDDDVAIGALKGRECYGGLGLGATRDLTALVLVFSGDDDRCCAAIFHA